MKVHRPLSAQADWGRKFKPTVEQLEDRLVPGQALDMLQSLSGLLAAPVVALLGQEIFQADNSGSAQLAAGPSSPDSQISWSPSSGIWGSSSGAVIADSNDTPAAFTSATAAPNPERGSVVPETHASGAQGTEITPMKACAQGDVLGGNAVGSLADAFGQEWLASGDQESGSGGSLGMTGNQAAAVQAGAGVVVHSESFTPISQAQASAFFARSNLPDQSAHDSLILASLLTAVQNPVSTSQVPSLEGPIHFLGKGSGSGSYTPVNLTGGVSPGQIRNAYGFNQLSNTGAGTTIAIVDAYNDPNIFNDVNVFDQQFTWSGAAPSASNPSLYTQFGAATSWLTQVYQSGTSTTSTAPSTNAGWDLEISLDVEWAHAIAPGAKIVLVEARSSSYTNLFDAVQVAVTKEHANVVSMSWGGSDSAGEQSYDSFFKYSSYPNVAFVASAGDTGGVLGYPATSPYVLSVGGTGFTLNASSNIVPGSETAWSDGGGGVSTVEALPGYQKSYGLTYSGRANPDVAYNADDVNSPFYVYDSVRYEGGAGWWYVGGTSAGSPQWAGLIALSDQTRLAAGKAALSTESSTSSFVYTAAESNYSLYFNDITTGSTGFNAGPGYDLATGLGSPKANNLVPYLSSL